MYRLDDISSQPCFFYFKQSQRTKDCPSVNKIARSKIHSALFLKKIFLVSENEQYNFIDSQLMVASRLFLKTMQLMQGIDQGLK